jgi:50S ribosomal protein L16 3-hydroxylase
LARELLQRLAEDAEDAVGVAVYKDPKQPAVERPGEMPPQLFEFARDALEDALKDPQALARALGEYMTEPKPNVWFDALAPEDFSGALVQGVGIRLDRRTKMMFDAQHIFINGESFRTSGRDATLMKRLADERCLSAKDLSLTSAEAQALLVTWLEAGWLISF